jgi:hypothetical protein
VAGLFFFLSFFTPPFFEMFPSLYILGSLLSYVNFALAQSDDSSLNKYMCLDSNFDGFLYNDRQRHSWVPCQQERGMSYLRFPTFYESTKRKSSFDISFQCLHVPDAICQKAKRAFQNAGDTISQVVLFKEPVRVNATLMSFCKVNDECGQGMMILGGSSPARAIPLLNDDGLVRLHPQALVKQFGLPDHPVFAPFDILSVFNADAPFWFEVKYFIFLEKKKLSEYSVRKMVYQFNKARPTSHL